MSWDVDERKNILTRIEQICKEMIAGLGIKARVGWETNATKLMAATGKVERPCQDSVIISMEGEEYQATISITDALEEDPALPLGVRASGVDPFIQGEIWLDKHINLERWGFRVSSMEEAIGLLPNLLSSLVYWFLVGERKKQLEEERQ